MTQRHLVFAIEHDISCIWYALEPTAGQITTWVCDSPERAHDFGSLEAAHAAAVRNQARYPGRFRSVGITS